MHMVPQTPQTSLPTLFFNASQAEKWMLGARGWRAGWRMAEAMRPPEMLRKMRTGGGSTELEYRTELPLRCHLREDRTVEFNQLTNKN